MRARLGSSLLIILGLAQPALAQVVVPPFPQFLDQSLAVGGLLHSAIMTSDGAAVWDFDFASDAAAALRLQAGDQHHFAFMQCYGGGMIDDIARLALPTDWTATSAARHYEWAWAGADRFAPRPAAIAGGVESGYGLWWSEALRNPPAGVPWPTPFSAAAIGYANDMFGPVALAPAPADEVPQYLSNGPLADNDPFAAVAGNVRVILFGGSTNEVGNWNSLSRVHDTLTNHGIAERDIYAMYTGGAAGVDPLRRALPGWIDDGTTSQDMQDAWLWLANELAAMGPNAQVLFWSSWGHGTRGLDITPLLPDVLVQPGERFVLRIPEPVNAAEIRELRTRSVENSRVSPMIQLQTDRRPGALTLYVNDVAQPLEDVVGLPDGSFQFWFSLADEASFDAMLGSVDLGLLTDIRLEWDDTAPLVSRFFGLTSGRLANALTVSNIAAPPQVVLILLGVALLALRWRGRN